MFLNDNQISRLPNMQFVPNLVQAEWLPWGGLVVSNLVQTEWLPWGGLVVYCEYGQNLRFSWKFWGPSYTATHTVYIQNICLGNNDYIQ